jgi:hypothetical protein
MYEFTRGPLEGLTFTSKGTEMNRRRVWMMAIGITAMGASATAMAQPPGQGKIWEAINKLIKMVNALADDVEDLQAGFSPTTYVVEANVLVPVNEARNVTLNCEPGDLALSGAYRTGADSVPSHFEPADGKKVNPTGWRFIFVNPRPFDITPAYEVLCLDLSSK